MGLQRGAALLLAAQLGLLCLGMGPNRALAHAGHGAGGGAGRGYVEAVAELDSALTAYRREAVKQPTSWSPWVGAAEACIGRAELTGDWRDFARAESLFERAFAVAAPGAGPFLARAQLHLTLHRLGPAEADLKREESAIALTPGMQQGARDLRCDLSLLRGEYAAAESLARVSFARDPSSASSYRLATVLWNLGGAAEAESLLAQGERRYHGTSAQYRAWYRMQRGDLAFDRGRLDQALTLYEQAETLFPGWWMVYGRVARARLLQGQTESAIFAYQELIARTGLPEFMDDLAEIYVATGSPAPAARWIEKAARIHERRLREFPEAAYGHALRHYLRFGDPPSEAVRLAEKNRALRPNGESLTWLAEAQLRAGEPRRARDTIAPVLDSRWRSPETLAAASEIYRRNGDATRAGALRDEALAANPHAMSLIEFLTAHPR